MHDGHRINWRVFFERDVDQARRCVDLDHAVRFGNHAQAVHVNQRLRGLRQLAKAVNNFFKQGVNLVCVFGGGELFIKTQAQMNIAAIVAGQQSRCVQVDLSGHAQWRQ